MKRAPRLTKKERKVALNAERLRRGLKWQEERSTPALKAGMPPITWTPRVVPGGNRLHRRTLDSVARGLFAEFRAGRWAAQLGRYVRAYCNRKGLR